MKGKNTKECKFYCSDDEKRSIEKLAAESGLSLSEYVCLKALNRDKIKTITVEKDSFDLKYLLSSINRIGNNFNQISKALNVFLQQEQVKTVKTLFNLLHLYKNTLLKSKEDLTSIQIQVQNINNKLKRGDKENDESDEGQEG